jgi:hypothetical protein
VRRTGKGVVVGFFALCRAAEAALRRHREHRGDQPLGLFTRGACHVVLLAVVGRVCGSVPAADLQFE